LSDDAQAWVWQHSRTKGVARLVLLALAHACPDDTATARMGTAELMRRANAGKGAVVDAITAATEAGELEIIQPGAGKRAALYRLPGVLASGPVSGPLETRSGLLSGPLDLPAEPSRSAERTASRSRSAERTASPTPSGPLTGPLQAELTFPDDRATRARASSKAFTSMREGVVERAPERRTAVIPDFARPLVDRITASGVIVKWSLGEGEWFTLDHLIQRSGIDMLAATAVRAAARQDVGHARYFLAAWRDLPPAPAADTAPVTPQHAGPNVVPIGAAPSARPSTADQRVTAALTLAAQLAEEDAR
jgi:hypothetical protein